MFPPLPPTRDQEELKRKLVEADEIDFKWTEEDVGKPPLQYVGGIDLRRAMGRPVGEGEWGPGFSYPL